MRIQLHNSKIQILNLLISKLFILDQLLLIFYSLSSHKQQFLQKLIKYTVILPLESDGQDRVRKLPYVSSEVLSIDNQFIYKEILEEQGQNKNDYFLKLMGIFSSPAADNQILLGYFVKIIESLYKSQKKLVFYLFITIYLFSQTAKKIFSHKSTFFQHLNKQSVGNIFKLFLILLQTEDGYMLQQRKSTINKLIISLVQQQQLIKSVVKNILVDMIMKFQTFSSGDQFLREILQSERILEIFKIYDSQAIDDFIIGYLTKAMQRICTEGNNQKQLIIIDEKHKELIKSYIKAKKIILIQKQQIQGYKNQTREFVKKTDKKIIKLLTLIKLSLQNGIINFLQPEDIENLWKLISTHQFNDIIKVKIFDIFSLIYTKKDQETKKSFQLTYFDQSIQIFTLNKNMFGYFLYKLWKVQSKRSKIFTEIPEKYLQSWKQVNQYMIKYENYQQQTKKVIERYSNRTKVVKLVVDEEDGTVKAIVNSEKVEFHHQIKYKSQQEVKQPINITQKQNQVKQKSQQNSDPFDFSFQTITTKPDNTSSETINSKIKADPFDAFDFFDSKQTKKQQVKPEQKKKVADFTDFSAFF